MPHCKKYHRKKPHRVEPNKCMWNKIYKRYRFKSICDELEVDFKPCIKFTVDLGRYADKDNSVLSEATQGKASAVADKRLPNH